MALAAYAAMGVTRARSSGTPRVVQRVGAGYRAIARGAVAVPFDPARVDGLPWFAALGPAAQRARLAAAAAVARVELAVGGPVAP